MEDPDYIGKETIALAEAKQRAIQTMNNHKALSMAKAITPMEELLELLIKKYLNGLTMIKKVNYIPFLAMPITILI